MALATEGEWVNGNCHHYCCYWRTANTVGGNCGDGCGKYGRYVEDVCGGVMVDVCQCSEVVE